MDLGKQLAAAEAREQRVREKALEVVRSEPELEGDMPEENLLLAKQVGYEAHARAVVRSTKASILRRLEAALSPEGEK